MLANLEPEEEAAKSFKTGEDEEEEGSSTLQVKDAYGDGNQAEEEEEKHLKIMLKMTISRERMKRKQ